jgi:hypothetical protein
MIELRRRYNGSKGSGSPSFSRLPKEYQEVEYLESTGTQYIETPILGNDGTNVQIDFQFTQYRQASCLFGSYINNPYTRWYFYWSSESVWNFGHGADKNVTISNPYDRHIVEYLTREEKCVKIDSNIVKNFSSNTNTELGLKLFWCHNDRETGVNHPCFAKIFSFKATTETAEYDFIPCYRISDRVAGMYDIVNDVFYTNAGTGEFLVGPDVRYNIPPEYQQVEYLEDTGTQIIVIPNVLGYGADDSFVGDIRAKISIHNTTTSTTPLPYKIAYGWGNGAQVGVKAPDLYWHNYGTMTNFTPAYLNIIYDTRLEILGKVSNLYINDVYAGQTDVFNNNSYLTLFNATGANVHFFGKIYELTIQGTKNLTLIPCFRKEDDVAGMYDLVSGKFYTNAGAGTFEIGLPVIG